MTTKQPTCAEEHRCHTAAHSLWIDLIYLAMGAESTVKIITRGKLKKSTTNKKQRPLLCHRIHD